MLINSLPIHSKANGHKLTNISNKIILQLPTPVSERGKRFNFEKEKTMT